VLAASGARERSPHCSLFHAAPPFSPELSGPLAAFAGGGASMFYLAKANPLVAEAPYKAQLTEKHNWSYSLQKHQEHIKAANPSVNSGAPLSRDAGLIQTQARTRQFCSDQRRAEIGRENRKLVDRLTEIAKPPALPGGTARSSPGSRQRSVSSSVVEMARETTGSLNRPLRQRTQRGIEQDNASLVRRILSAKTTFDTRKNETDFRRHKRCSQSIRRMPERSSQPRSLPPLRPGRPHSTQDLRGLEDLLTPGDLRRPMLRSESGPPALEDRQGGYGSGGLLPFDCYARNGHAHTAPLPEIEGDDDRGYGDVCRTSYSSTPSRASSLPPGRFQADCYPERVNLSATANFSECGGLSPQRPHRRGARGAASTEPLSFGSHPSHGAGRGRPPRPPLSRSMEAPGVGATSWPQQCDSETDRREWVAAQEQRQGSKENSQLTRISLADSENDIKYEDDWADDSFGSEGVSPSRANGSRSGSRSGFASTGSQPPQRQGSSRQDFSRTGTASISAFDELDDTEASAPGSGAAAHDAEVAGGISALASAAAAGELPAVLADMDEGVSSTSSLHRNNGGTSSAPARHDNEMGTSLEMSNLSLESAGASH